MLDVLRFLRGRIAPPMRLFCFLMVRHVVGFDGLCWGSKGFCIGALAEQNARFFIDQAPIV